MTKAQKDWGDTAQKKFLLGGGTLHILSWRGDTIGVGKKHMLEGGAPYILSWWGEQLGWGHCTTLKAFQLWWESKTGTSGTKDYIWGGGHRTYFLDCVNNWGGEGGGHRTYFVLVDEGNNWGGDTAQHWEQKQLLKLDWLVGRSVGRSGRSGRFLQKILPLRGVHLASWNLPNSQLSWEFKMESSVAIIW